MRWLQNNMATLIMALFLAVVTWIVLYQPAPAPAAAEKPANPRIQGLELPDIPVSIHVPAGNPNITLSVEPARARAYITAPTEDMVKALRPEHIHAFVKFDRPDPEPGPHKLPILWKLLDPSLEGVVLVRPEPDEAIVTVVWKE